MVLETPIVVGTNTKVVSNTLLDVCLSVYQHDGDSTVRTFYRCGVEIKIKAELQDGYGPTHEY